MSDAIILSSLSGKSQEKDDDNDDYDSAVPFDRLLDDHVGGCHVPGLKVAPEPVGSEDPSCSAGSVLFATVSFDFLISSMLSDASSSLSSSEDPGTWRMKLFKFGPSTLADFNPLRPLPSLALLSSSSFLRTL